MSLEGGIVCSDQQPKTRTELLRKRQGELRRSLAGKLEHVARTERENTVTTSFSKVVDWWTLAEGYKENALEALASSPRYQRYARKREKARAAERPDPYNTHEVRIKKPSTSLAEKISSAEPPPKTSEAYSTPRRSVKHFTDEVFYWKARLEPRQDVDQHGKNKWFDPDEHEGLNTSMASYPASCSFAPKGGQRRRALVAEANRLASHPHGRPSAPDVARQALKKRHARRQALEAASRACQTANGDEPTSSVRRDAPTPTRPTSRHG